MDDQIKVLVVDDEPGLLELTKAFLEENGCFQITTAESGGEALGLLSTSRFDAMVSDYQMPIMDGIELLKRVRKEHASLPFILYTGKGREEVVIDALNAGADFYLQKGGQMNAQAVELTHKIKQAVARRRAEEALRMAEFSVARSTTPTIWFAPDSSIMRVNKAACDFLGYSEAELLSMSLKDIDPWINDSNWPSIWSDLEKKGSAHVRTAQRRKNGSQAMVEVDISIMEMDGRKYAFSFVWDTTDRFDAEAKLKEAENRFRSILNAAQETITTVDRSQTILSTNKLPPDGKIGPVGHNILDHIDKEFKELVKDKIEKVFNTSKPDNYEIRRRGSNGDVRWYESNLSPLFTGDQVTSVVIVGRDITDRRQAETQFRELFNSTPDAIFIHAPDGRFLAVNDIACSRLGYSMEELRSMGPMDIGAPEHADMLHGRMDDLSRRGEAIFETVHVARDGRRVPTEISSKTITFQGQQVYMSIARDITERKLAERSIKDMEVDSTELIDGMISGFIVIDVIFGPEGRAEDFKVLRVNRAFEPTLGLTSEQVLGKKASEVLANVDKEWVSGFGRVALTGEPMTYRHDFRELGRVLQGQAYRTRDGHVAVTFMDITDRARTEKALAETQRKMTILNDITRHDILNELTVVQGRLELARMKFNDPEVAVCAEGVCRSLEKIHEQICFVRDYETVGANEPIWQRLDHAASKCLEDARQRGVEMVADIKGTEVLADPMLEKVFCNLVDNSLRHGGKVKRIALQVNSGDRFEIIYQDDGVGIPSKDKENIFLKGFGRHTGLGMFMIKEVLGITGMTIREDGIPGAGARFVITVPPGRYRRAP